MQPASNFFRKVNDEFSVDFFDERACRMWILQRLHPEGVHCPRCGKAITNIRGIANFYELKRVSCKHCKKLFSALTGTFLNGAQINLRVLFLLAVFLALKIDKKEIARMLNIHPETVNVWSAKFKEVEGLEKV